MFLRLTICVHLIFISLFAFAITPTPTVTPNTAFIELQSGYNGYQGGHAISISDHKNGNTLSAGQSTIAVNDPESSNNIYTITILMFDLPFTLPANTTLPIELDLKIYYVTDAGNVRFVQLHESNFTDPDITNLGNVTPAINRNIATWEFSNYNVTPWHDIGAGTLILGSSPDKTELQTQFISRNQQQVTFTANITITEKTNKLAFALMPGLSGTRVDFYTEHTYEVGTQPILRLRPNTILPNPQGKPTPTPAPSPIIYKDFYWQQNPENRNYYTIATRAFLWTEAQEFAESIGGHLVTITSFEEDQWIQKTFGPVGWIGLRTDTGWVTGEPVTYTRWAPGEPSNDGVYVTQGSFLSGWNDRPNTGLGTAIIEIEEEYFSPLPTITPAPTPNGEFIHNLNLVENNFVSNPPIGYTNGKIRFGNVLGTDSQNTEGIRVDLNPGQGMLLFSLEPIDSPGLMQISTRIKTSNTESAVALIALNSSLDGQYSFINLSSNGLPVGQYKDINLYYNPPDGHMFLGIQAVNSPFSTVSTTVYVDDLFAQLNTSLSGNKITTQVDGSFEYGFINLLENFNNVTGMIVPIFKSFTDIAIQLSIQPNDVAANIGTIVSDSNTVFPGNLISSVKVRRGESSIEGTFALVITNGYQNFTLFRNIGEIPSDDSEILLGGASFFENNPYIPVTLVVQNGGTNITSSVLVDDLYLFKQ